MNEHSWLKCIVHKLLSRLNLEHTLQDIRQGSQVLVDGGLISKQGVALEMRVERLQKKIQVLRLRVEHLALLYQIVAPAPGSGPSESQSGAALQS